MPQYKLMSAAIFATGTLAVATLGWGGNPGPELTTVEGDQVDATEATSPIISTTNTHITYKFTLAAGASRKFPIPNSTGLPVRLIAAVRFDRAGSWVGPTSEVQAVLAYDGEAPRMTYLGENNDGSVTGDTLNGAGPIASWGPTGEVGQISALDKELTLTAGPDCTNGSIKTCLFYITMDY